MSQFANAVRAVTAKAVQPKTNLTRTTNGELAYKSTGSGCLDLFFNLSAYRGNNNAVPAFKKAMAEDAELALRIALYGRDIRGGARERKFFRDIIAHLEKVDQDAAILLAVKIPEVGRWDDLITFQTPKLRELAYQMFAAALNDGNGLAAKWAPREKTNRESHRAFAIGLRTHMGISAKQYRKLLVGLTNVVETAMCNKTYSVIDYSKLPSVAGNRYAKAFQRNDNARYSAYLAALSRGDKNVKVNAATLFPYDVLKQSNKQLKNAQWDALPNFVGEAKLLPMIDTSGSMSQSAGGSTTLSCRDVAFSLGIYLADKCQGAFGGMYMTFSDNPDLAVLPKTNDLDTKYQFVAKRSIVASTDIQRAFDKILNFAIKNNVPDTDMPQYLVILSDMQFNQGVVGGDRTSFDQVKQKFNAAGYTLPNIVYWNINAVNHGNVPVTSHKSGAALVSGFSPDIVRTVLSAKTVTPMSIMLDAVMIDRYKLTAE